MKVAYVFTLPILRKYLYDYPPNFWVTSMELKWRDVLFMDNAFPRGNRNGYPFAGTI